MKIKVSEATPLQLNWLVAQCEGIDLSGKDRSAVTNFLVGCKCQRKYRYSSDWLISGPIIERERIQIFPHNGASEWCGVTHVPRDYYTGILTQDGPTPLVAAMRCYVSSKLGDEVDVPDELLGGTNPAVN